VAQDRERVHHDPVAVLPSAGNGRHATIELSASRLVAEGWTLRTGMSPGADQAFYRGALAGSGGVELYLPWPAFQAQARLPLEGSEVFVLSAPAPRAYSLAARFHPSWDQLAAQMRDLRARDVHEVLGRDLESPAALLVCWTPDRSLDGQGPRVGGTGQALRIAHAHGISVLNLSRPGHARRLRPRSAAAGS
jgi:hypothetical protein